MSRTLMILLALSLTAEGASLQDFAKQKKLDRTVKMEQTTKLTPEQVAEIERYQKNLADSQWKEANRISKKNSEEFWKQHDAFWQEQIRKAREAYYAEYYKEQPDYWKLHELAKKYQQALDRR